MKPLSILVVDDVDEIRNLVSLWLRTLGHTVECAISGKDASRRLRAFNFDLVITDIIMPEGDGLELIIELKRARPGIHVLAVSGGGTHLRAADCLRVAKGLGAHALLLKPFNRAQLLSAVNQAFPPETVAS